MEGSETVEYQLHFEIEDDVARLCRTVSALHCLTELYSDNAQVQGLLRLISPHIEALEEVSNDVAQQFDKGDRRRRTEKGGAE